MGEGREWVNCYEISYCPLSGFRYNIFVWVQEKSVAAAGVLADYESYFVRIESDLTLVLFTSKNRLMVNPIIIFLLDIEERKLLNVVAIYDLPLPSVIKAFSTMDVFKKLNCYENSCL